MLRAIPLLVVPALGAPTLAVAQVCDSTGAVVQVLGSGGPRVNRERSSTSYLVRVDGKGKVLVDAGGGAFLRFGQAGGRLEDLALIAISHVHPDHVADLPALLWLSHLARRNALPISGPTAGEVTPDFEVFLRRLFDEKNGAFPLMGATLGGSGLAAPLSVNRVDAARSEAASVFDAENIRVTALSVPHGNIPTLAYKVQAGGLTAVFASDQTGTNAAFIPFARGADILVMHLTIGVGESNPLHAAPAVVGQVARDIAPRHLILSHVGPIDVNTAVAAVKQSYSGRVTVATDLLCVGQAR